MHRNQNKRVHLPKFDKTKITREEQGKKKKSLKQKKYTFSKADTCGGLSHNKQKHKQTNSNVSKFQEQTEQPNTNILTTKDSKLTT